MISQDQPLDDNRLQTKSDFQRAVRQLFDPLVQAFRAEGARVNFGPAAASFDIAAESLETFMRPLWGLAPLTAGGGSFEHWDLIREGLIRGTDPDDSQYWGRLGSAPGLDPKGDQRKVEMAALGFAMALVPEEIYWPLSPQQRDNVISWLAEINDTPIMENNWQFFRVMVNLGFARVGGPTDESAVNQSLNKIDSYYIEDGWYQDGTMLRTTDFYGPFALHFYGLIYAVAAKESDPQRASDFRERARLFARHWESRFDSEGRVIPYGRSMTYRFAGASFWGALAFADIEALPWGRIRNIWAQHLRWWAQQNIFTSDGRLSIGWSYDNLHMRETYNSPGSPYWALKAFLPLALSEDHPFWTAVEEGDEKVETQQIQKPAGVIVNRTTHQAVMLNSGRPGMWFPRQGPAKYGKMAYSSAFPFALEPDDLTFFRTAESTLALIDEYDNRQTRASTIEAGIDGNVAWSIWQPFNDVQVFTAINGQGPSHCRIHIVDSGRQLSAIEGGFAIEDRYDPATLEQLEEASGSRSQIVNHAGRSMIVDPSGYRRAAVARLQPNSSLRWPRSVAPILTSELGLGKTVLKSSVAASERPGSLDWRDLPDLHDELQQVVIRRSPTS